MEITVSKNIWYSVTVCVCLMGSEGSINKTLQQLSGGSRLLSMSFASTINVF